MQNKKPFITKEMPKNKIQKNHQSKPNQQISKNGIYKNKNRRFIGSTFPKRKICHKTEQQKENKSIHASNFTMKQQLDGIEQCAICQEELKDFQIPQKLQCSHRFHLDCIQKWFITSSTCPMCRKDAN